MNHQQKLEAIRRACVAANPKELKEGDDPRSVLIRNIGLADVLLVFRGRSLKGCDPNETYPSRNEISILQRWNIRNDDLSKQSEDTVDFIHGLLKGV